MCVVMMFFITADVCLRALANMPVLGPYTYEAIGFMMVILVFFAVAHCQVQRSHVNVDLVASRLPRKAQLIIDSITNLLGVGLFGLITWRSIVQTQFMRDAGTISIALTVPLFPFLIVVAFGSALLCLVLIVHFLDTLLGVSRK